MKPGEATAETLGKLERAEEQRAPGSEAVGQQEPLEGRDMRPLRVRIVDEEALVVKEHVGVHQPDDREK